MLSHARARPLRLIDRFRAPLAAGLPNLMPTLRAYGGLQLRDRVSARQGGETLGRLGSLEVKLAATAAEVRRAQKLRFKVFYKEKSAVADAPTLLARRDIDPYDAICDHLLVLDHAAPRQGPAGKPAVVGTYRLLRQDMAERHHGFYSATEFDIDSLVARHRNYRFLELGRSCVLPSYRNKRTVELMWHGIWAYVLRHGFDAMIGCASLEGIDPDRLALPLAYLHHFARAPEPWRTRALPHRYVEMNRMRRGTIDQKAALRALPPLLKGYLRLGAAFGDGAVIDRQFGTTDVLVILPVAAISTRYIDYFGPAADRHAA